MISPETRARIRRYFYAEHWKVGTIATELNIHPDAVHNAIESERFKSAQLPRTSIVDPYGEFIRLTLEQHPGLRATRIHQMVRDRGYSGSIVQLRRTVARLRPPKREAFLQLHTFPGEHYGKSRVMVRGNRHPIRFRPNHRDSPNSRFP